MYNLILLIITSNAFHFDQVVFISFLIMSLLNTLQLICDTMYPFYFLEFNYFVDCGFLFYNLSAGPPLILLYLPAQTSL